MSKQVVSGYSDVMSRLNLATNGNFRINQRALFGTKAPISVGQFFADTWFVNANSTDFVECFCDNGATGQNNAVTFSGRGKKDQFISFACVANLNHGYNNAGGSDNARVALTSVLTVSNTIGKIPIIASAVPPYYSSGYTDIYSTGGNPIKGGETKTNIRILATAAQYLNVQSNRGGGITVTLLADGEFSFTLGRFQVLAGAFRNPPDFAPVHYAEDLQRCQRYYQTGYLSVSGLRFSSVGSSYYALSLRHTFPVLMAGTPTVTLSGKTISGFQDPPATTGGIDYLASTVFTASANARGFTMDALKATPPDVAYYNASFGASYVAVV